MDTFVDIVRVLDAIVFGTIAVVVFLQWRRRADASSGWLTATFGVLAGVLVLALVAPEEAEGALEVTFIKVLVVGIVLYPWLLYRFMSAFDRPPPGWEWTARILTGATLLATVVVPSFPGENDPRPVWFQLYALLVIAQWATLSVVVAVRLWRAGIGHVSVSQRRMQLMAAGSALLAAAILPAAASTESQPDFVRIVSQLLPLSSAALFITGFSPPGWLRALWRRADHDALRQAEMELMTVLAADEIAGALLPHVARVFGGRGAMLVGLDGRPAAVHGLTDMEATELAVPLRAVEAREPIVLEGHPGVLALPLQAGWLVVQATSYTPFFGVQELSLLQELGSFTDLALQRAELFESERRMRLTLEQTTTDLETLVYGVSHDLKSPLISLMGYLEYLRLDHGASLNEEGRYFLERMDASASYMHQLIQDLLELSRIGKVQTDASDVALADLVTDLVAEVRQQHPGVVIEIEPLPVVHINPVRARQLFTNLIENAARHGGRADLRINILAVARSEGRVEISIADNGVGIAEPYRERVFGIFERLEARPTGAASGTGMGLAICRKIVEQVGGRISIAPSETGADVRIVLPVASTGRVGGRTVEEAHR